MIMTSHSIFEVDGQELEVFKAPEGSRAVGAVKVIWRGRHFSYVTAAGKMFSSRVSAGSWFIGRRWKLNDIGLIEDAIALGLLPKSDIKKLKQLKTEEKVRSERAWASQYIGEYAKTLGIVFTKAQAKIIAKHARP
jgi:hypothetical protein